MELRKDYLLNRWIIISEKRGERPREFRKHEIIEESKICYFCPGNEHLTPNETFRIQKTGSTGETNWKIRCFLNKFPFVVHEGSPKFFSRGFFAHARSYGYQEVLVETGQHSKQLADLSEEELKEILDVYVKRIEFYSKKPNIKYVAVFKNSGREGGTSIIHTHTQIAAYNKIPTVVQEEVSASNAYKKTHKKCPYCEIAEIEMKTKRKVFDSRHFAVFTPYASRFNYEVWIFPKKHLHSITQFNEEQMNELAMIMKKLLAKIQSMTNSYNYYLHYSPKGKDLHFHIEITPRIAVWAGFENSTGEIVNSVSPETAAKFYISAFKIL